MGGDRIDNDKDNDNDNIDDIDGDSDGDADQDGDVIVDDEEGVMSEDDDIDELGAR